MSFDPAMPGVDLGTFVSVAVATFALTATVIGFLFRQMLRSYRSENDQKLQTIRIEYQERLSSVQKEVQDITAIRRDCETRVVKSMDRLDATVNRYVDKWLEFQQAASTMEVSRGKKVDALFTQVDHWKEEVRFIKPALFQKLDELYKRGLEELRQDTRNYVHRVNSED